VSELTYSYDDRKTLLDVYYDGGGKVGEELDLRSDIYDGLIAVANHAAVEAVKYEVSTNPDGFSHRIDWNGTEWWVTTRKGDIPWAGRPLSMFVTETEWTK
jgi:hypothetical protein